MPVTFYDKLIGGMEDVVLIRKMRNWNLLLEIYKKIDNRNPRFMMDKMPKNCPNCNKENVPLIPKYVYGSLYVMCRDCWDNYNS